MREGFGMALPASLSRASRVDWSVTWSLPVADVSRRAFSTACSNASRCRPAVSCACRQSAVAWASVRRAVSSPWWRASMTPPPAMSPTARSAATVMPMAFHGIARRTLTSAKGSVSVPSSIGGSVSAGSGRGGMSMVDGSVSATCSSAAKSSSASSRASRMVSGSGSSRRSGSGDCRPASSSGSGGDGAGSAARPSSDARGTDSHPSVDPTGSAASGSAPFSGGSGAAGMATRRRPRMDSGGSGAAPAVSKPCSCAVRHQSTSPGHAFGCSAIRRIHGRQPGSLAMACSWSAESLGLRIGSPVFLSVLIPRPRPSHPGSCPRVSCTRLRVDR